MAEEQALYALLVVFMPKPRSALPIQPCRAQQGSSPCFASRSFSGHETKPSPRRGSCIWPHQFAPNGSLRSVATDTPEVSAASLTPIILSVLDRNVA